MEGALKVVAEVGVASLAATTSRTPACRTVAAGARGFAQATRTAGDALLGTFVATALPASEALRRRLDSWHVDCHAVAERGEAAMLELARGMIAPTLPRIILRPRNAGKTADSVADPTTKHKDLGHIMMISGNFIKHWRPLLNFDHAASVVFTESRKAKPADVPHMFANLKDKLVVAGVLMHRPDTILQNFRAGRA